MRASSFSFTVAVILLLTGCRSLSERYVAKRPDLDPTTREAILKHRVILGMFPDEAIVAAYLPHIGYASAVKADPARWPEGADTQQVLWSERAHPDNSQIDINFWTRTQFGTTNFVGFQVVFTNGRAASITRLHNWQEDACLSEAEATRLAQEAAVKHGYRLADYRKTTAGYGFLKAGFWMAHFERKKESTHDQDFSVWIDDYTREAQVELWKQ